MGYWWKILKLNRKKSTSCRYSISYFYHHIKEIIRRNIIVYRVASLLKTELPNTSYWRFELHEVARIKLIEYFFKIRNYEKQWIIIKLLLLAKLILNLYCPSFCQSVSQLPIKLDGWNFRGRFFFAKKHPIFNSFVLLVCQSFYKIHLYNCIWRFSRF